MIGVIMIKLNNIDIGKECSFENEKRSGNYAEIYHKNKRIGCLIEGDLIKLDYKYNISITKRK
jgi:hypothetical protein